jgi:hypothetical protein
MMDPFDKYGPHFVKPLTYVTSIAYHSLKLKTMWTMRNQQLLVIKIDDKYNKHFTLVSNLACQEKKS